MDTGHVRYFHSQLKYTTRINKGFKSKARNILTWKIENNEKINLPGDLDLYHMITKWEREFTFKIRPMESKDFWPKWAGSMFPFHHLEAFCLSEGETTTLDVALLSRAPYMPIVLRFGCGYACGR